MNEHERLIAECDVVSFDIFDTLVQRNLSRPADLFRLSQELLNSESSNYITENVAPARIEAEVELRHEAIGRGVSADSVALADIYERLGQLLMFEPSLVQVLLDFELEAERRVLRVAPYAAGLLQFARDQGKPVIAVSDTYLPGEFITATLGQLGLGQFSEVYLSCEHGASKADGSLWAVVAKAFPDRALVHFGDNNVSDIIQARAFGLGAHQVPKSADVHRGQVGVAAALNGPMVFHHLEVDEYRLKNVHRSMVNALVGHELSNNPESSVAHAVGFGAFGPMLLGFVQWLHEQASTGGHDHLFFLARDGYIMRQAYEAYWGERAIPSTYLLASRRLLNVSAIGDKLTNRDVDFLTQGTWSITLGEYFSRLGIDGLEAEAGRVLESLGLSPSDPGHEHGAELRAAFWLLEAPIVSAAKAERAALVGYWEQAGFLAAARPAVVDIGWHGSLQASIQRILGISGSPVEISGLYFGLHGARSPHFDDQDMGAYIDEKAEADQKLHQDLVRQFVSVLEFCFTRPEGTAIGVSQSEGGWTGVHSPDALAEADRAVLADLQEGALAFCRAFRHAVQRLPATVSLIERDIATENMVMLVNFPLPLAAETLGRRMHADGFGTGVTWRPIGAPLHPAEFYGAQPGRLADEHASAGWKPAFVLNAAGQGLSLN